MKAKILKKEYLSFLILLVSVFMIIYGFNRGEVKIVLDKAIRICMECIGIG